GRVEAEPDAVARPHVLDPGSDLLHDACALVAEHHGPAAVAERAVGEVEVGAADARSGDADEHLAVARRVEIHPRGGDGLAGLADHGGPHETRYPSSASRSGSPPSPGPSGGAIVPSGATSSGAGRSQSRRSADQAGGSSGTSTYGHDETASARWRL